MHPRSPSNQALHPTASPASAHASRSLPAAGMLLFLFPCTAPDRDRQVPSTNFTGACINTLPLICCHRQDQAIQTPDLTASVQAVSSTSSSRSPSRKP